MNLRQMLKNAGYSVVGNLLSIPIQMLTYVLIARSLGVARFGIYGFAMAFTFVFSRIAQAGLNVLATRELARQEDPGQVLTNIYCLGAVMSGAAVVLLIGVGSVWRFDAETWGTVALLGAANLLYVWSTFLNAVFRAEGQMKYEGALAFARSVVFLGALALVIHVFGAEGRLLWIAGSLLVTNAVLLLVGMRIAHGRLVRPTGRPDGQMIAYLAREAWPMAVAVLLGVLYARLNIMLLKSHCPAKEVGQFSAAVRLSLNLGVIPMAIAGAWLPALSRHRNDDLLFASYSDGMLRVLAIVGLPIGIGVTLMAHPVIRLLYGAAYQPSADVLQVAIWSSVLLFFSIGMKTMLEATHRQLRWTFALAAGALASVALNLLLIPRYGALGAAWATVGADVVILSLTGGFIVRSCRNMQNLLFAARLALALLAMAAVAWLLLQVVWWWVASIAGAVAYAACIVAFRVVSREEIQTVPSRSAPPSAHPPRGVRMKQP